MAEVDGNGPSWRELLPLDDRALLAQCAQDRFRASGPGGQKRNKTDSAVRLRHLPTGLAGEATESRSQHENRARALRRLRRAIAFERRAEIALGAYGPDALRPALEQGNGGLRLGQRDARYLPAVAELLDVLAAAGWRLSEAAQALGVSTGALSRFITADEALLARVNRAREVAGHGALHAR